MVIQMMQNETLKIDGLLKTIQWFKAFCVWKSEIGLPPN